MLGLRILVGGAAPGLVVLPGVVGAREPGDATADARQRLRK